MTGNQQVHLSIVMACRNEVIRIRTFLDSLLAQELHGFVWEAIIADGMSDDGTRTVLEEYCARHQELRIITNPNRIVSTGLNRAILSARGEIILRMDAHTVYATDYCRRSVELLKSTGADNVGGPARTRASGICARAIAAAYHSPFSTGGAKFHDENHEGWVDTVPYGCWEKSTLERIGLFDESLVRNQDDELNLRLLRLGGRIWQSPMIVSWYSPRSTLRGLFHQYFQYGFWKVAVMKKHRLPGSWRQLVPALFILANAALLVSAGSAAAAHASNLASIGVGVWLGMAALYACSVLIASVAAAARHGWVTLPYLPAVFAAFHVSYGLGFLLGVARFLFASHEQPQLGDSVFTRMTR